MKLKSFLRLVPLLLPLGLGGGCVTAALWENTELDNWNEPAPHPEMRLFHAEPEKDVLVVYQEYSERHDWTRTRAYFLYQNQVRMDQGRHPRFVSPEKSAGKAPIPVWMHASSGPTSPASADLYAILEPGETAFRLYSGDREISWHKLPVYNDGGGGPKRVALTPLTLMADAAIIGAIGFVYAWANGGWDWLH